MYIYTSVLPSISIDGDRLAASTFSCICRSFVLSCHLDRFVALLFKLALDRRFWATFERQVGPGPAVLGTFERQDGLGPAVLGTLERQVAPGPAVLAETSVSGTRRKGHKDETGFRALSSARDLPQISLYRYTYIYIYIYIYTSVLPSISIDGWPFITLIVELH